MMGKVEYQLIEGIDYDLVLSNTGEGIILTGHVRAVIENACVRCLEPATYRINGEVEGYFLLDRPGEEIDLEDDEFVVAGEDGVVDLAPALLAALVIETPQVLLCDEECKGLCPKCGVNRNLEPCACSETPPEDSPFAALRGLSFD